MPGFFASLFALASKCAGVFALGLAAMAGQSAPAQAQSVGLQAHRVAYELSLDPRKASAAISNASGLIALEFTGNACQGYATNFRQVMQLGDSEGQARQLDFRVNSAEGGDAKSFRFTLKNTINGQVVRDADGEARKVKDGSMSVVLKKPAGRKMDFDGEAIFPSEHMRQLIGAALKGERRFIRKIFDGSEGGEKIFETISSIGQPLSGVGNDRLEPILRNETLDTLARWAVTTSYYEDVKGDRTPAYTMRFVGFENGVAGDISFEFPDFTLKARAVKYEALKAVPCKP